MPLSMIATPMPSPSTGPSDFTFPSHTACAPVTAVVTAMCERTIALPDTAPNSPSPARASISRLDALNTAPEARNLLIRTP